MNLGGEKEEAVKLALEALIPRYVGNELPTANPPHVLGTLHSPLVDEGELLAFQKSINVKENGDTVTLKNLPPTLLLIIYKFAFKFSK